MRSLELFNHLEKAWYLISRAQEGPWKGEPAHGGVNPDWQELAKRWRDAYNKIWERCLGKPKLVKLSPEEREELRTQVDQALKGEPEQPIVTNYPTTWDIEPPIRQFIDPLSQLIGPAGEHNSQSEFVQPDPEDFCRSCGANVPPIDGEGTCPKCDPEGCAKNQAKLNFHVLPSPLLSPGEVPTPTYYVFPDDEDASHTYLLERAPDKKEVQLKKAQIEDDHIHIPLLTLDTLVLTTIAGYIEAKGIKKIKVVLNPPHHVGVMIVRDR